MGTIVDHFQVVRRLGAGGMAEVYLARDTKLGRRVALKVIHTDSEASEEQVQGFLAEARITARFNHPHIVTIHAVGEWAGRPYLALEYLEGQALDERLQEERPGLNESMRIGLAVADALQEAHKNRVLHRDLKPANVFIPKDGRIRVVDFGISKVLSSGERLKRLTSRPPSGEADNDESSANERLVSDHDELTNLPDHTSSGLVGTPLYLSPERWQGGPSTEAGDLWALGLILYELLAGRHPFEEFRLLVRHVTNADPVPLDDLPADVSPALRALIALCLSKDPTQRPSAKEVADQLRDMLSGGGSRSKGANPFRGLRAFEERHADHFFGRETEVLAFVERLRELPMIPVVGTSGAGKSSFVRAGVIPRLREKGSWLVFTLRPGNRPFEALAAVLTAGGTGLRRHEDWNESTTGSSRRPGPDTEPPSLLGANREALAAELVAATATLSLELVRRAEMTNTKVLLFVDQLEELFTLVPDAEIRRRFMRSLYAAADDPLGPVRVIFTLREDFLSRLAEGVDRTVVDHVSVLRRPNPSALRDMLLKPLEGTGFAYEDPELVDDFVREVQHEPACLPLLAFAAETLWDRRDRERRLLLRESYEAMGGVGGALAEHADGVLQSMSAPQMQLARQILLRLVTSEGTRRVATRRQVLEGLDDEARSVLGRLTESRLISASRGRSEEWEAAQLELVHEALIQRWNQLAHWLDESRDDVAFLAELEQAAELWDKRGRSPAEVWHGSALAEAERKAQRCQNVPELALAFLQTGAQRARRQLLRRRALWASAIALLVLIALTAVAVSIAVMEQEQEAQRQRGEAQRQRGEAQLAGARTALEREDPFEARAKLRLALETGAEPDDTSLARALWWRLDKHPLVWKKTLGGSIYDVAFSPSGDEVAAGCMDHAVYRFNVKTSGMSILRGHTDQVLTVTYAPNRRYLASGTWSGQIRIWEMEGGRSRSLHGHTNAVRDLTFSPDSSLLASASSDGTVRLWDVAAGQVTAVLPEPKTEYSVNAVAFNPAGTLLAAASWGTVRLWDVKTGKQTAVLQRHKDTVASLSFSPSGTLLVSGGHDKTLRLWNVENLQQKAVFHGHKGEIVTVSFSPSGKLLASGGFDKAVRLWDVESGHETASFAGYEGRVRGVAFSPDGTKLVTGSDDKAIRLWDVELANQTAPSQGHRASVVGLEFVPSGTLLASGSLDQTVRLWEVETGRQTAVLEGHQGAVRSLSVSPAGKLLASGDDRLVYLWNPETARKVATLQGHESRITAVSFNHDGTRLASGSTDRSVRVWDVASKHQTVDIFRDDAPVLDVAFSPTRSLLAYGNHNKTIRIWDIESRRQTVLRGHQDYVFGLSFSPDGARLVSGSGDQTVRLWDVKSATGQIVGRHGGRVYRVDFHPSGRRVAAASSDGTARIWDTNTGEYVELRGHRGEVNNIRFSPDGEFAATASDDGTVRLWKTDEGTPLWRAPLLRPDSLELFTHNGWIALAKQGPVPREALGARWRKAVEDTARIAAESDDGSLLCLGTHAGTLEVWDPRRDQRLDSSPVPGITALVALSNACVSLGSGIARRHDRAGDTKVLREEATAIAWNRTTQELLVAAEREVAVLGPDGETRSRLPADVGATAVGRMDRWIAAGYKDGNIELLPTQAGQSKPNFKFEEVPSSSPVTIIPGPTGTLIAGYANGLLGMWNLRNGVLLERAWLHGPVAHLLIRDRTLYAASVLGTHTTWDLSVFHLPYCEFLRRVWRKVPIVWEEGLPVLRSPPPEHRCQ